MNQYDESDDLGEVGAPHGDILAETFGALVGSATPPDAPSAPERNLPVLRRRVRRRRVVKSTGTAVGVAACLVAVAGGLSWALPDLDREPLPAETVSTPSPSPTSAPSTPTSASPSTSTSRSVASIPYRAGWRPEAWRITPGVENVACGASVDDLVSGSSVLHLERTGDLRPDTERGGWSLPVRIAVDPGTDIPWEVAYPTLVWIQDGVVVDVGGDWNEYEGEVASALAEDEVWTGEARAGNASQCRPETIVDDDVPTERYGNERPGGTFEVRAVSVYDFDNDGSYGLLVSDPVEVTLESGSGAPFPEGGSGWTDPEVPPLEERWVAGYGISGSDVVCLAHQSSFVEADPDYTLEITGTVTGSSDEWSAPVRLVPSAGASTVPWGEPALLLIRPDGRLAGYGRLAEEDWSEPRIWPHLAAGTTEGLAVADSSMPCRGWTTVPEAFAEPPYDPVPAGSYTVRAVTEIDPESRSHEYDDSGKDIEARRLVFSDPVRVTVNEDGSITQR
ncbi:hypothetical protein L1785_01140 [Antribacter sp. KLBMP9083]|uniref:Uncharacterized protein n=1 Tax=Antribacter soli TaxID=2910976 RepID=A0AA41U7P5_9MICO|nr:hypothetical protein [Antribacter soli]MCF4119582.1 hypothetical protein [Antribacter soli]